MVGYAMKWTMLFVVTDADDVKPTRLSVVLGCGVNEGSK